MATKKVKTHAQHYESKCFNEYCYQTVLKQKQYLHRTVVFCISAVIKKINHPQIIAFLTWLCILFPPFLQVCSWKAPHDAHTSSLTAQDCYTSHEQCSLSNFYSQCFQHNTRVQHLLLAQPFLQDGLSCNHPDCWIHCLLAVCVRGCVCVCTCLMGSGTR